MSDPSHGPIERDQRAMMNGIAEALDEMFNGETDPKAVAFVLLTARFDYEDGRVNYISNGNRAGSVTMMKELIGRFERQAQEEDPDAARS